MYLGKKEQNLRCISQTGVTPIQKESDSGVTTSLCVSLKEILLISGLKRVAVRYEAE